ncbi:CHAT domain-containing protein, partial [Anaerolineae bacterium CFX7]|nr:CHAT domain-containing protein [Anaerolineae bacterium CFX7]
MLQYETLDVLIEKNGAGYVARIVNSPVGQARTSFAPPFTPDELKTFFARVAGREPTSGSTLSPQQWIEQMGARLFDAVFHDETLMTYRRSRDEAERQAKGLRVRLRLNDAPELADLPWEYLYDATRRNYLALSKETPIVRYLELSERVKPLAAPAPINLLAVLASPQDRDALDVEGEWTRLQNALAELVAQNKIRLTRLAPPTLDALRAQLRQAEYHILHFIGHGDYD